MSVKLDLSKSSFPDKLGKEEREPDNKITFQSQTIVRNSKVNPIRERSQVLILIWPHTTYFSSN